MIHSTRFARLARVAAGAALALFSLAELPVRGHTDDCRDPFLNVRCFGARGDGEQDDTEAFERALFAASAQADGQGIVGNTVVVPKGRFRITRTLNVGPTQGLRVVGAGCGPSEILWDSTGEGLGPFGATLFVLTDSSRCVFADFSVANVSGLPMDAAFVVESDTPHASGEARSSANEFRDLRIDGRGPGVQRGLRFVTNAEELENSDHRLRQVHVSNYLDAGFSIEHDFALGLEFRSCRFEGGGRGLTGLATDRGTVYGQTQWGGSFRWFGGGGGGNVAADFELGDVAGTIVIDGGRFEGSARFLHTGGPSGNQWPVIVRSVVWLDDMLGAHPQSPWPAPENLRIVNFQFRGPLIMTGNQFGVPPDPLKGPQVAKDARIIWNPLQNFGQFVFVGNYVATTAANPFTGFTATGSTTGIYPTVQQGNLTEYEDYGSSTVLPLEAHVTSLSTSATPTVDWLHTGRRLFTTWGGSPITNLLHGRVGQELVIFATGDRTITHTPNIRLQGAADFVMKDGDNLTLAMVTPGVWTEIARTTF